MYLQIARKLKYRRLYLEEDFLRRGVMKVGMEVEARREDAGEDQPAAERGAAPIDRLTRGRGGGKAQAALGKPGEMS